MRLMRRGSLSRGGAAGLRHRRPHLLMFAAVLTLLASSLVLIRSTAPALAADGWAAYNDLAWASGQLESNITKITSPNGSTGLPSTGELVDVATGVGTGVDLTVTGGIYNAGTIQANNGPDAANGSDAFAVFDGIVSTKGHISYIDDPSPGGDLVLTLTDLDPTHTYDVVYNGHRDNYTWAARAYLVTISGTGAGGFTNVSSAGTDNNGAPLFSGPSDSSTRMPPDNDAGWVARWDGVDPGADGTVVLTVSYDGDDATAVDKGKYASALALFDKGVGETLKFAAIGDYGHSDASYEQSVADIVDAETVDLVVTTGDNTYGSPTPVVPATSIIDYNIGKSYADYIGAYIGGYGSGSATNRFFPSPGNHDFTDGGGIIAYTDYFTLPGAGVTTSGTSGSELYYDFVQGPVHFFAIDSQSAQSSGSANTQKAWLQAQLAASTAQWKIVYFHHVAYSSSSAHGSSTYMQWPFEEWGADAVLGGHDHVYERILRDDNSDGTDMVYITTGAGGRSLYSFGTPVAGSQVRYAADYGTVIAEATDTSLTFEFWSITDGATLIDTYTVGPPTPQPAEWVAYNDMNTLVGSPNPANVTSHTYATAAGALMNYATGAVLPVTVTGSTVGGYDQQVNGGPVSSGTDAYAAFDGIVDLSGTDELDAADWDGVLTFSGLDPSQEFAVTLSANRFVPPDNGYPDERFAKVTIEGVDASTAASSSGVVVNSPTSVSFSVGNNFTNGYVAKWVAIDPGADGSFTVKSEWDDTLGSQPPGTGNGHDNTKGYAMSAFKLEAFGEPAPPPEPPDEWVAYNDMNTSAGSPNPATVTSYTYQMSGALKDYATGAVLPVTMTGSTAGGFDPHGNGGPVSNGSSDAYAAFNGIVDLSGTDELDAADWDGVLTFSGLDPSQEFAVTLSANRDNPDYANNRFAKVTLDGVDASTAASSPGVVVNSPTSVSFSVGQNAENGYVAKWVDIDPGADGSFTVTSEWDDTLGTVPAGTAPNTKGYAMSAFKLEAYGGTGTGMLRVTSSPAVPTQVLVDGVPMDSWGLKWVKLPVGSHTVSFTDVQSFTTPDPMVVDVTVDATTTVDGVFTPRGWLRVSTSPAVPSTITVDGVPMNDWGVWTDLEPGSYEVCYGAVADLAAPACETAAVTAGALTSLTGVFTSSPGAPGPSGVGFLRVTTNPAVPAQILIDGVPADTWGLNWVKVAPGAHTVSFTDIEGYTTPPDAAATVTEGETTVVAGNYVLRGSLQVTTSPALPATIYVDGLARDDWGMWTDLEAGSYEVCYETIPGYTTPVCTTETVIAGTLTSTTGTYTPNP